MISFVSHSPAETERFAATLAKRLHGGDLLAFRGGLGAGKTAFVRGLARGLGSDSDVSSPTFALVHEYVSNPPLYHFDMYRIHTMDDLYSTGFFDYLDTGGIFAVEWSENIEAVLPAETITVSLVQVDEETREITVEGGLF